MYRVDNMVSVSYIEEILLRVIADLESFRDENSHSQNLGTGMDRTFCITTDQLETKLREMKEQIIDEIRAEVQALTPYLVLAMGALQKHPEESNNDTLYTLDRKVTSSVTYSGKIKGPANEIDNSEVPLLRQNPITFKKHSYMTSFANIENHSNKLSNQTTSAVSSAVSLKSAVSNADSFGSAVSRSIVLRSAVSRSDISKLIVSNVAVSEIAVSSQGHNRSTARSIEAVSCEHVFNGNEKNQSLEETRNKLEKDDDNLSILDAEDEQDREFEDNELSRTNMVDYTASAYLRNWKMVLLIILLLIYILLLVTYNRLKPF
ncbi:uncharacterized protein LOC111710030 [Eurytemora carolleeae]|uniref:uncharacterized protein LOC111710030 n=1 Tax=Eurytemora carolleeae TaxID=1294199 RepID=UPI000C790857|nr:uncharacterized protein LOC111710030 [Eurytemora carolleeae]|eukprot:XP_023339809.1 uncharacterized protein LOC111710030 [Eurytemora affinis]